VCISWDKIKDLMLLMHGTTMKIKEHNMLETEYVPQHILI